MRRRTTGQSIIEMALIFPLLVMVLFGIIDLGYYVYGYSTIYQAARNGAEKASMFPPFPNKVGYPSNPGKPDRDDTCAVQIIGQIQQDATLFSDLTGADGDYIRILYPTTDSSGNPVRELGQPIEVSITYSIEPLTPLFRFVAFGNNGRMTVAATSRRSIESLGENPNGEHGVVCTSD